MAVDDAAALPWHFVVGAAVRCGVHRGSAGCGTTNCGGSGGGCVVVAGGALDFRAPTAAGTGALARALRGAPALATGASQGHTKEDSGDDAKEPVSGDSPVVPCESAVLSAAAVARASIFSVAREMVATGGVICSLEGSFRTLVLHDSPLPTAGVPLPLPLPTTLARALAPLPSDDRVLFAPERSSKALRAPRGVDKGTGQAEKANQAERRRPKATAQAAGDGAAGDGDGKEKRGSDPASTAGRRGEGVEVASVSRVRVVSGPAWREVREAALGNTEFVLTFYCKLLWWLSC